MSGQFSGEQARIKEMHENAYYIHCQGHELNLVMERACSSNVRACKFFANINSVPVFFANSSDRVSALDKPVSKRVSKATPLRWTYNARTVNFIYEHQDDLYDSFCELESNAYTSATIDGASKLKRTFDDPEFISWLNFFQKVMPHVTLLYNVLQSPEVDATRARENVENFSKAIDTIRSDVLLGNIEFTEENLTTRRRGRPTSGQTLKAAALEVCDVMASNVKDRFSFTEHLESSSLFFSSKFKDYEQVFPEDQFKTTVKIFPLLEERRLRTELELLYSRKELRFTSGAIPLLKFLLKQNMQLTFVRGDNKLTIISTMPMTTAEAERCFSTLKRIKTFLRNSMAEDRLSALAMLSIEKELVSRTPDFNSRIIDKFASQKERRLDFQFKVV